MCVCLWDEILFSHKKEGDSAIFSNMEGPGKHYAKWNKPDRQIKMLYDITFMWNVKYTAN